MKRTVIFLLALASMATAYLTSHSQQPAPAQVLRHTRVGVVNIGLLYAEYEGVRRFKADLDREIKPFQERKDQLEDTIKEWKAIVSSSDDNFSPETKEMARRIVLESARQLEDLAGQIKSMLSKKLESILTSLNDDVNKAIDTYAAAHGYHLVLAYGEPQTPLTDVAAFTRKMAVVDGGGLVLIHVSKDIDITRELIQSLNEKATE
jgi:Skp family chaperone for outer membrane proteins